MIITIASRTQEKEKIRRWQSLFTAASLLCALAVAVVCTDTSAIAQTASGVRSFSGGVAPMFTLPGGRLYIDNQGTQGFIYSPGQYLQTYNFRNPTTGQAWSGAVMTFGPQLSIGLIQGANQGANPTVLPGPPPQTAPLPPIESDILNEIP